MRLIYFNVTLTHSTDSGAYFIHVINPFMVKFPLEDINSVIYGQGLQMESVQEFEINNPMAGTWEFALDFSPHICAMLGNTRLTHSKAR